MIFIFLFKGDLLKELPSFNRSNFSKYCADAGTKVSVGWKLTHFVFGFDKIILLIIWLFISVYPY